VTERRAGLLAAAEPLLCEGHAGPRRAALRPRPRRW
jgi:hypothetical protein